MMTLRHKQEKVIPLHDFYISSIKCKMREKIKTGFSVCIILLLLPYVAVVFRTGSMRGIETAAEETGPEEFVEGILPGQMPVYYEEEALKAQAVIVRTNLIRAAMEFYGTDDPAEAAKKLQETDLEKMGFFYQTKMELEQLWGYSQFERYDTRVRRVVEETRGKILALEGQPVALPYHAVSAGRTRAGDLLGEDYSYLQSVECPGDLEAADYLKIQILSIEETPEILRRDEAGYVMEVRVGEETCAGEEFRDKYGLNSSCFTVQETERGLRITTKGLGHGLGMSMYQANLQAGKGADFLEILFYFYKNVECISFS